MELNNFHFSLFLLILTFDFDLIFGLIMAFGVKWDYFEIGVTFINLFRVYSCSRNLSIFWAPLILTLNLVYFWGCI